MAEMPKDKFFVCSALLFGQGKDAAMSQLSNKEGNMRTKKQLIVCLSVCLVLSFVSAVYAAPPLEPRGSAPVTVVNPASKPIPVVGVDQQPIQKEVSVKICGACGLNCAPGCSPLSWGNVAVEDIYIVPLNKRLVIEYFSCQNVNAGSYGTSYTCSISTSVSNERVEHWLPTTPYGHPEVHGGIEIATITNPPAFISAGQKVQIYADPGTEVVVTVFRSKNTSDGTSLLYNHWSYNYDEYMYFSFSGYLLDAPIPIDTGQQ
jgi:hypothetical protein